MGCEAAQAGHLGCIWCTESAGFAAGSRQFADKSAPTQAKHRPVRSHALRAEAPLWARSFSVKHTSAFDSARRAWERACSRTVGNRQQNQPPRFTRPRRSDQFQGRFAAHRGQARRRPARTRSPYFSGVPGMEDNAERQSAGTRVSVTLAPASIFKTTPSPHRQSAWQNAR